MRLAEQRQIFCNLLPRRNLEETKQTDTAFYKDSVQGIFDVQCCQIVLDWAANRRIGQFWSFQTWVKT